MIVYGPELNASALLPNQYCTDSGFQLEALQVASA